MNILSKSELQKNIGKIKDTATLILNKGKPEFVIVPYYDGTEEFIQDYIEEYEIKKNQEKLEQELRASKNSGVSSFTI